MLPKQLLVVGLQPLHVVNVAYLGHSPRCGRKHHAVHCNHHPGRNRPVHSSQSARNKPARQHHDVDMQCITWSIQPNPFQVTIMQPYTRAAIPFVTVTEFDRLRGCESTQPMKQPANSVCKTLVALFVYRCMCVVDDDLQVKRAYLLLVRFITVLHEKPLL
jgi:hypothetical protein